MMKKMVTVILTAIGAFFGWKMQKAENEEIETLEAQKVHDMAVAVSKQSDVKVQVSKDGIKEYKKRRRLKKMQAKDIEKAAAEFLGISLGEFRGRNKKLKNTGR